MKSKFWRRLVKKPKIPMNKIAVKNRHNSNPKPSHRKGVKRKNRNVNLVNSSKPNKNKHLNPSEVEAHSPVSFDLISLQEIEQFNRDRIKKTQKRKRDRAERVKKRLARQSKIRKLQDKSKKAFNKFIEHLNEARKKKE